MNETNKHLMYIIAILGILTAAAGIWFMAYNSGKDRYKRKQLKKLYKRSRLRVVTDNSILQDNSVKSAAFAGKV